ncbi:MULTISPECIES: glycerol kinase GlpK [Gordonia]|uniref:Glycerol kinase n=2 Tax=Gordonia TaxID=2053 RepID=A0A9X3D4P7_9ACTN|nr:MULTISPECIES: glycerol kinase GlpK [Gordonia]MAU83199.1 glycerol kinase [Gordonia sp. (in: high G+C Gram-positive bacteria)]MAU83611.1 glycerol kinase [Gordonia sp. (in: high G+C Gram-positive bacteria)]MCX2964938.1 glycerol kinase GlpK [Gordonia aquimaris]
MASANTYVAAVDQGTTSTRAMIFDRSGRVVSSEQIEHQQIFPQAGWVEHDAAEIWRNTRRVMAAALASADLKHGDIATCGVTNQRETTLIWDRETGVPIHNAIVWQDTRTNDLCDDLAGDVGTDRYRDRTGLPLSTYFAGPKIRWLLDHVEGARHRAEAGELCFGTMDSWTAWNMTGGRDGGLHITDVTNASRTMLMDLRSLQWDEQICAEMGVPTALLPEIRSSSEVYGPLREHGSLPGVPLAGILGDQQAATFGQACLSPGEAKNTYGTGNFLLLNTGTEPVFSDHGLLTTVCYRIGDQQARYALEGSIAVTGSLVQWLRDNLGLFADAADIETLAAGVDDNGGAYFVPAFSGLFAPRWRPDARGVIVGLTRFVNKGHLARAALEASAFQTREVIEAMQADSGVELSTLKVDGGMVVNDLLMQFQADILDVPVVRPVVNETTALGAAYAAGLAVGYWESEDEIRENWAEHTRWEPRMPAATRDELYAGWNRAVEHSLDLA